MLTATLSHELLTPLNSIITISALMENRGNTNKNIELNSAIWQELLQYFKIIYNSAMIMQYLIKSQIDMLQIKTETLSLTESV